MKVSPSSVLVAGEETGSSFFQKLLLAVLIMALMFAFLPIQSALAAPDPANNYAQEWSNKLHNLRYYGSFYERIRVYPADFEDRNELAQAHDILNQYGTALRSANTVVANHMGFDQKGRVVNDIQADKSLKALSEQLRIMRVLQARLDALEGEYRLLPASAVTTTTAQ